MLTEPVVATVEPEDHPPKRSTSLAFKLEQVACFVRGVVTYRYTGMILTGRGGIGKSHTVINTLDDADARYHLLNSRLTGRGLFDCLKEYPTDIFVMEDAETLMDDRMAWGVLRSAMYSQSKRKPPERKITWNSHGNRLEVTFTGAIIYVANRPLHNQPELLALAERVPVVELCVTDDEIRQAMYEQAAKGYRYGVDIMTPEECLSVTDYLLDRARAVGHPLDMRLQRLCYHTYIQARSQTECVHWEDQVDVLIGRKTNVLPTTRKEQTKFFTELAHAISAQNVSAGEKQKLWEREAGTHWRNYYRYLRRPTG